MTIVNDASTINVIDDASLALASIVNYDRKWHYNLERHLLTTLGASITDGTRSVNYDRNTFIIQATGQAWKGQAILVKNKSFQIFLSIEAFRF